jgi:hypothetical protein
MSQLKKSVVIFFLSFSAIISYCQNKKQLLANFVSNDWKQVKAAKQELESMEGTIIPDLISLLDENRLVKLQNTGSLIFPGAERFFGHGQILDYDVDYIAIRVGWLLEDITFNNFGFSGIHLPEDEAVDFIKLTFPVYYNNSVNRKKIENASKEELRDMIQTLSITNAKNWWKINSTSFSRLEALDDALKSFDEKRQVKALFYMRNGTTKCTGLTTEYYDDKLIKEISRLSRSDVQRISEHAKLILLDTSLDWLKMKEQ